MVSLAVVMMFLAVSLFPLLSVSGDGSYGSDYQGSIKISSAKELSLIGVDDRYPLDGEYVQTCDIDFGDQDFNGGFAVVLKVSLIDGTTLKIDLFNKNGVPITSDSDILVFANEMYDVITPGSSSMSFTVPYTSVLTVTVIVGGEANLLPLGANGIFAAAGTFDIENNQSVSKSVNSNGNMNPIGSAGGSFTGIYDGRGYNIEGLRTAAFAVGGDANSGLFCSIGASATICNMDVEGDSVSLSHYVNAYAGILASKVNGSRNPVITDCRVTGNSYAGEVNDFPFAFAHAGGIVGYVEGNIFIRDCYAAVNTTAASTVDAYSGGLIGYVKGEATITGCSVTGDVKSFSSSFAAAGGLAGNAERITATDSFTTGNVSSTSVLESDAGGLVGVAFWTTTVTNCFTAGNISALSLSTSDSSAKSYAGGFAGSVFGAIITDSYSAGDISSSSPETDSYAGGLFGHAETDTSVTNCYSAGKITAKGKTNYEAGVGNFSDEDNDIINCYYLSTATINPDLELYATGTVTVDGMSSGTRTEDPSGGYDENELGNESSYFAGITTVKGKPVEGWDFTDIWFIDASQQVNNGYPILRASLTVMDPVDAYANIGDTVSFKVNANNRATHYQWQMYENATKAWSNVNGETDSTYTIRNIVSSDIGKIYRCEVRTVIDNVIVAVKTSGPAQILPADSTTYLTISDAEELSKVGSNEIVNGMIFRPSGNYVQTDDISFSGMDFNEGFDVIVIATLSGTDLEVSLRYGDNQRTMITSASEMSISVNGITDTIKPGESSKTFVVPFGLTTINVIAGGEANNIPNGMDKVHPNFLVSVTITVSSGSTESAAINSNGNVDPIGSADRPFSGTYDGKGYDIEGLQTRVFTTGEAYSGLFGYTRSTTFKDIHLESNSSIAASITAGDEKLNLRDGSPTETDRYTTPDLSTLIAFSGGIGGYIGGNVTITGCYANGDIISLAAAFSGGLLGFVEGNMIAEGCFTTGNITALHTASFSSGLVCAVEGNLIMTNCYTTGEISSTSVSASLASGLVAIVGNDASFSNCYTTGNIYAEAIAAFSGGFAGVIEGKSSITDCYTIGNITAVSSLSSLSMDVIAFSGGLAAVTGADSVITNCYTTGEIVTSGAICFKGSLANYFSTDSVNYITNCYFLQDSTYNVDLDFYGKGNAIVDGGFSGGTNSNGYDLAAMQTKSTYNAGITPIEEEEIEGWNFTTTWCIDQDSSPQAGQRANNGLPFLRSLAFTEQPKDIISDDPVGKTFRVIPNMSPTGYQWQKSTDGDVWDDMIGETSDSYTTIPGDELNDQFRCIISYGSETIPSKPAGVLEEYTITTDYDTNKGSVRLSAEKMTIRDTVSILITPKAGYIGNATTDVGTLIPDGDNRYLLREVTEDCIVTIEFDTVDYAVTTDYDFKKGNVALSAVTTTVEDVVTITIRSGSGYTVGDVAVNTGTVTKVSDMVYRLTSVTEDCTVTVMFDTIEYTVTADYDAGKGRTNLSTNRATVESNVWVTVTPDTGYMIGSVTTNTGKLENIGNGSYALRGITNNCVVTVEFVMKTYSVTTNYDHDKGEAKLSANIVTMRDTVSITIKANEGYSVGDVSTNVGTLVKIGDGEYRLTNIVEDCIITIGFGIVPDPTPATEDDTMLYLIIGIAAIIAIFGIVGAIWFFRFRT